MDDLIFYMLFNVHKDGEYCGSYGKVNYVKLCLFVEILRLLSLVI